MNFGGGHLQPVLPRENAPPSLDAKTVDLELLCPLSLIRTHTKTDDVPTVTDAQLELYRASAFEAAEKYTSRIFTQQRPITESVARPRPRRWRDSYTFRLKHPSSDGRVYLYGSHNGLGQRMIDIGPGNREVTIPVMSGAFDASSCCDPCRSGNDLNNGWKVLYRAGVSCADDVPRGIIVGVLKFIAWMVENPGDVIMTVRNSKNTASTGITGTNNGAFASGAIEQWRIYVDDAV